ncbi:hypothetical protein [Henriciella sp.]|uniref:hypothetical protein n=1 Tax=Henriciella sp. TaxID=1968823 RepID=UPI00260293B7|nr:hypothetical protein [Henriciella sp.]
MSKRINKMDKQVKKHCGFVWAVTTFNISNDYVLDHILFDGDDCIEQFELDDGELDREAALGFIQDVREKRRPLPNGWLEALKETLSQAIQQAEARGDLFDKEGHPVWYAPLPADSDGFGQLLTLVSMIAVVRDCPAFLLEKLPSSN